MKPRYYSFESAFVLMRPPLVGNRFSDGRKIGWGLVASRAPQPVRQVGRGGRDRPSAAMQRDLGWEAEFHHTGDARSRGNPLCAAT